MLTMCRLEEGRIEVADVGDARGRELSEGTEQVLAPVARAHDPDPKRLSCHDASFSLGRRPFLARAPCELRRDARSMRRASRRATTVPVPAVARCRRRAWRDPTPPQSTRASARAVAAAAGAA